MFDGSFPRNRWRQVAADDSLYIIISILTPQYDQENDRKNTDQVIQLLGIHWGAVVGVEFLVVALTVR